MTYTKSNCSSCAGTYKKIDTCQACACLPIDCIPVERVDNRIIKCPAALCDLKNLNTVAQPPCLVLATYQDTYFNETAYFRDISVDKCLTVVRKNPSHVTSLEYSAKVNDEGNGPLHFKIQLLEVKRTYDKCGKCEYNTTVLSNNDYVSPGINAPFDVCFKWVGQIHPCTNVTYKIKLVGNTADTIKLVSDRIITTLYKVSERTKCGPIERKDPNYGLNFCCGKSAKPNCDCKWDQPCLDCQAPCETKKHHKPHKKECDPCYDHDYGNKTAEPCPDKKCHSGPKSH